MAEAGTGAEVAVGIWAGVVMTGAGKEIPKQQSVEQVAYREAHEGARR
ncbi:MULTISPECIES: hypothetical protein [unclassified Streptomyces]